MHALQAAALDHDHRAVGLQGDPVAVVEAVGELGDSSVAPEHHDPTRGLLVRREVAGIGEQDGAVDGDGEIVGAAEAGVGEVRHGAVGGRELQSRCRGHAGGERREHAREFREVDAAVLGDEDRAVGRERGTVRAAGRDGDAFDRARLGPDPEQRARSHAGRDHRAVGAPHGPSAKGIPLPTTTDRTAAPYAEARWRGRDDPGEAHDVSSSVGGSPPS